VHLSHTMVVAVGTEKCLSSACVSSVTSLSEALAVVDALHEDVTDLSVGDEVFSYLCDPVREERIVSSSGRLGVLAKRRPRRLANVQRAAGASVAALRQRRVPSAADNYPREAVSGCGEARSCNRTEPLRPTRAAIYGTIRESRLTRNGSAAPGDTYEDHCHCPLTAVTGVQLGSNVGPWGVCWCT
jgi:hypothetical protein